MPSGDGNGMDQAMAMQMFAMKTPPENTIKRIEDLENQLQALSDSLKMRPNSSATNLRPSSSGTGLDAEAISRLEDLMQRVVKLETRADKTDKRLDTAEEEIEALKRRLAVLESMDMSASPTVSGDIDTGAILKQVNMVKVELQQVRGDQIAHKEKTSVDIDALRHELRGYTDKEVGELAQSLTQKLESGLEGLKHELDRLRAEFETFKNRDFKDLEARVAALEKKFLRMQENLANLKIPEASGGGVSEEAFRELAQRVADLENALNALRMEFSKWMKEMQDSLNQKADFAQMDKALQDRLSDIVKALTKQFADKGDTRKALKIHEKQFQNLYNLIMNKAEGGQVNEEDAMFSKKPLGGLSCASCEKGLIDMYGKRVEFMPWNKLPFRDPAERIARVGQGFSKMLSMINPDQLSRYE